MSDSDMFVVAGLISEKELKARFACRMLDRCGGSLAEAATAMNVAIATVRKWCPEGVLGERGSRRGRKSVEDQDGAAERSRQYLDRVAGRLDGGDGAFVVEGVVSSADLRSLYIEHVHERSGRDVAATARVLGVSVRTAGRRLGIDADPAPPSGKRRGRPPGLLRPRPETGRAPARGKAPYWNQIKDRPVVTAHFSFRQRFD